MTAPGLKLAVWRKQITYLGRLALLVDMVRWAATDRNELPSQISKTAIIAAGELVMWFGNEAMRIHRALEADEDEQRLHKLLSWMQSYPDKDQGFASKRTRDHLNHLYTDTREVKEDLNLLVEYGYGGWRRIPTERRPRVRFFLEGDT